ncbi:protein adenylyltransferase SelO [Rhodoferax sp.]|uniref:protein adenylyltransferase SelO n=1 Tax=Rhodoferax sp. TaxID=50421 RepID=UPI0025D0E2D2|nr:YdiU family protein [Rhodoferax sp.]
MTIAVETPTELDLGLAWRNRFATLGSTFYTHLQPTPLPAPYWVGHSLAVARELGLDPAWLTSDAGAQAFTGNMSIHGAQTLASVYSGHQFGQWAGQLGDGRAILLGEVVAPNGQGLEVQFKGAGRTPYSRMGDGRAVLRSSIREFLCSEAMHGLDIPTSRALCITGSDAPIRRETVETAAVVTRVAPSFIRFGHFEHFAARNQIEPLRQLADFVIDTYYPACRDASNPYAALLQAVTERTAELIAQWQAVGFCHGVMNTDNMSILGLTLDYGPFQFLDGFDPGHICNHSDDRGRYAYDQQPNIGNWNLFCLGQALLPLIGAQEPALAALETYKTAFPAALARRMRAKLGLVDAQPGDQALADGILALVAQEHVDFTIFWRALSHWVAQTPGKSPNAVRDLWVDRDAADAWLLQYSERLAQVDRTLAADLMLKTNPKFVLRNHLGEEAIRLANQKDYSGVHTLLALLETPCDEHPGHEHYADFPPDWASSIAISCSS